MYPLTIVLGGLGKQSFPAPLCFADKLFCMQRWPKSRFRVRVPCLVEGSPQGVGAGRPPPAAAHGGNPNPDPDPDGGVWSAARARRMRVTTYPPPQTGPFIRDANGTGPSAIVSWTGLLTQLCRPGSPVCSPVPDRCYGRPRRDGGGQGASNTEQ